MTFAITFVCYFGVALAGYAAFGSAVSDNILNNLTVGPKWLTAIAHLCVVIHVLAAYQVRICSRRGSWACIQTQQSCCLIGCAQLNAQLSTLLAQVYSFPVYDMMESSLAKKSGKPPTRLMSILIRSSYVIGTLIVAIAIPFFSDIM